MLCHQTLLQLPPRKAFHSLLPNSGRSASSVGNNGGLQIDDDTRRFTAESEKWLLMLDINASINGIATASQYSLIVVALSFQAERILSVMSCSLASTRVWQCLFQLVNTTQTQHPSNVSAQIQCSRGSREAC